MRILKILLMIVLVLAAGLGGVGLLLPRQVHLERSASMAAPPSTVFAVVDGFRQFARWSPWADIDPQVKVTMDGAIYGVGAHYAWSGNKDVGSGTEEIVASKPFSEVVTRLTFGGFSGSSEAHFLIQPDGAGSKVTWTFDTGLDFNPYTRWFGPLMKHGLGSDYDRGLARLKTLVESLPKTDFSGLKADLEQSTATPYLYVAGSSTTDTADIGKALGEAYGKVGAYMKTASLKEAAPPIAVTRRWDAAAKVYEFDAGIPVDAAVQAPAGDSPVKLGKTYAGLLLKVEYRGPYDGLGDAHDRIAAYKLAYGLQDNGQGWEQYPNDPTTAAPADLLTVIYQPVK